MEVSSFSYRNRAYTVEPPVETGTVVPTHVGHIAAYAAYGLEADADARLKKADQILSELDKVIDVGLLLALNTVFAAHTVTRSN